MSSVGRVSTLFMSQQASSLLQNNQSQLSRLQERVSAGQNILRPSDDPLGATQLLDLNQSIRDDRQYLRNIETGLSELKTSVNALDNLTTLINRATELATQGASITSGATSLAAIENEVNLLIDQTVQIGNTSLGGRYLFAGLKSNVAPFSRSTDNVTYVGSLATEPFARTIETSQGSQTRINLTGETLFGTVTSAGTPEVVTGGSGLLRTLTTLRQNLRDVDRDAVRARLDELKSNLQTVVNAQAELGSITNRLEMTQDRLESRKSVLNQQYAQLQNVNLPELISDLRYQEQITQVSLGVMSRVLTPSLMNFL